TAWGPGVYLSDTPETGFLMNTNKSTRAILAMACIPVAATSAAMLVSWNNVAGTDGDDVIDASYTDVNGNSPTDGPDIIDGGAGNDNIQSYGDADKIFGRDGNDTLDGGAGPDEIDGNDGDDVIGGREENDEIDGGAGNDIISGGDGDDTLRGGGTTVSLGNDTVYGGAGSDTIDMRSNGLNEIYGDGPDVDDANAGNDNIMGGGIDDIVWGGGGNDTINGGGGEDFMHGGDGDDFIERASAYWVGVTPPDDWFLDENGDERMLVDTVYGGDGNDLLHGGGGNVNNKVATYLDGGDNPEDRDTLIGGAGFDVLIGRNNNDVLIGSDNMDTFVIIGNTVDGYEIYDEFTGTYGEDDFTPQHGGSTKNSDTLFFARDVNPEQMTMIRAGSGNHPQPEWDVSLATDLPVTFAFSDLEYGHHIECVITGSAADNITGTDRPSSRNAYPERLNLNVGDVILTGAGNDTINSGGGSDLIDAGEGDDTLNVNGDGYHFLVGGAGGDAFNVDGSVFGSLPSSHRVRVIDLGFEDRLVLQGIDTTDRVEIDLKMINGLAGTEVTVDGKPVIELWGSRPTDIEVAVDSQSQSVVLRSKLEIASPTPFQGQGMSTDGVKKPVDDGKKPPLIPTPRK
ncbi:MAG: calcium-binding protein, partial [Planctomycetota bacterium]